ncbi:Ig-like domain-containing protein [Marmoricola sp. RAF53]|uniref:Ig-like domain-containing protein n=1 Tax=Marmoricola sp. RAF53 TaxID=3233059 RepID=UPI003F9877FC
MKITSRRLPALIAAAALPLAVLGFAPQAHAAVIPVLGPLKINPASGNQGSQVDFSTLSGQKCAAGTDAVQVLVTGQTMTDDQPGIVNGNTNYNQVQGPNGNLFTPAGRTMDGVFTENGVTAPSGTYTIRLQCLDTMGQVSGEFRIDTHWTATTGAGNGTYTSDPTSTATQTALAVSATDPIASGTPVTLTATVTPSAAAGNVQFKSGATVVGTAPVSAGTATLNNAVLPAGAGTLSAVFQPADLNAYGTSTGTRTGFVVAGPTGISGSARVGGTLTCSAVTGGIQTYLWKKNGASTGVTAASVAVPAAWLGASISCDLTSTKAPNAVTRSSAAVTIAAGAAPVARVKPVVLGKLKVGKLLTCGKGTWSPAATSYKYQWLRNGKPLAGRTKSTYKTVKADKGKKISCRVTTVKAGYLTGSATSAAKKIA